MLDDLILIQKSLEALERHVYFDKHMQLITKDPNFLAAKLAVGRAICKGVKPGCYIDGEREDDCVLDGNGYTLDDCQCAQKLHDDGKTKEDCEHWR